jgi:Cu/Zn superoxide dismutase
MGFRADLKPLGNSGVTGQVEIGVKEDIIGVSVNARGLEASVKHPQHIHENATCVSGGSFAFGGVILSLDGELGSAGGTYPTATPGGTINYKEHDSKSAVKNIVGESLDLANRTVVVHAADGTPKACGELNMVGS